MKLEDNICPICLYIYIKPVTMPCDHELCLACFKQNVEEANFCCPMCRTRISTWARKAARTKTLVNSKRWEEIQLHFPEQIQKREAGEEEEDPEMNALNISIKLAEPGEIRNEYEQQLKQLQKQRAEERRKEQEASEQLILQLQAEERRQLEEMRAIQENDEELAKKLSQVASPEVEESRTRSGASVTHSSRPATGSPTRSPSQSPYPYRCLTPISSGAGKLCVDKDKTKQMEEQFLKKKIKKDMKLITTTDLEKIEETFSRNCRSKTASATEIAIPETVTKAAASPTLTSVMSTASLHNSEILAHMSTDVCINLVDDESSNSNLISIASSPQSVSKENNAEVDPLPRSISSNSIDSITQELNHFRPIRSCPLTPPRKLPGGKVVEPKLIRTTPRNLSGSGFTSPVETSLSDIDAGSPVMQRRLSQLADERKNQVEQMSKSTNTAAVVSPDENLNPEKKATKASGVLNFAHLSSRNAEFKDISNSPLTTHDSNPQKKLIIPLESNLAEHDDWLERSGIISPVKIERVTPIQLTDSARKRAEKLSRRKLTKHAKVRYSTENPQPSLIKWVKKVNSVCINSNGNGDGLVDNRLDEVEGERKKSAPDLGTSVHDEHLATGDNNLSSQRSRRRHRLYQDPDFIYSTAPSSSKRNELQDNTSDNESEDLSFACSPKKRKLTFSGNSNTPSKKSKTVVESQTVVRNKSKLKATKQTLKSGKLSKSKSKPVRTMHDFFDNMKHQAIEDCLNDKGLNQEERDFQLAQELQKQFELEAKWHLNGVRFKGTSEEYSLRHKRKVSNT